LRIKPWGEMGGWKLSKEEFERYKKEAVEKFFPDIEGVGAGFLRS